MGSHFMRIVWINTTRKRFNKNHKCFKTYLELCEFWCIIRLQESILARTVTALCITWDWQNEWRSLIEITQMFELSKIAHIYSVQSLLSSRPMSKDVNIRIYKTMILPVVLYGCETWYQALMKCIGWGCLRTGCWGEYLARRGLKWRQSGENSITRSCVICTLRQVQFEWSSRGGWMDWECSKNTENKNTYMSLLGKPRERDY
jgi:hypothetical protein